MHLQMAVSMDKILSDARHLVSRLKSRDSVADGAISQSHILHNKIEGLKQFQENLTELNELAKHRPRANLILGLVQENAKIRQLQQENNELVACLKEHQEALELIMTKYREQMLKLIMARQLERKTPLYGTNSNNCSLSLDKICEMASVMQKAVKLDDSSSHKWEQIVTQLKTENQTLRELLGITAHSGNCVTRRNASCQTGDESQNKSEAVPLSVYVEEDSKDDDDGEEDEEENIFILNSSMNSSVVERVRAHSSDSDSIHSIVEKTQTQVNVSLSSPRSVSAEENPVENSTETVSANNSTASSQEVLSETSKVLESDEELPQLDEPTVQMAQEHLNELDAVLDLAEQNDGSSGDEV